MGFAHNCHDDIKLASRVAVRLLVDRPVATVALLGSLAAAPARAAALFGLGLPGGVVPPPVVWAPMTTQLIAPPVVFTLPRPATPMLPSPMTVARPSPVVPAAARTVVPPVGQAPLVVVAAVPPAPPPLPAYVPPSTPGPQGAIWIPGEWDWQRHGYVWLDGHYAAPPHAAAMWVGGGWYPSARGWVWHGPHWH
jgi:hypothetical protein